uniref:Uncharacterized protein n=1 Tax=Glossina pallidipes TaxID=7398 RepID=A0A1B0A3J2_GLOPL
MKIGGLMGMDLPIFIQIFRKLCPPLRRKDDLTIKDACKVKKGIPNRDTEARARKIRRCIPNRDTEASARKIKRCTPNRDTKASARKEFVKNDVIQLKLAANATVDNPIGNCTSNLTVEHRI